VEVYNGSVHNRRAQLAPIVPVFRDVYITR
jgi:hypothetical protein